MSISAEPPAREPNSWATVVLATALTLGGLAGLALAFYELGVVSDEWQAHAPVTVPRLVHSAIGLVCGLALGFTHRRTVLLLVLLLASRITWEYLAQRGWAEPGRSSIEGLALLYALYLQYNGRLGSVGPNNSSKPTPLRGAA